MIEAGSRFFVDFTAVTLGAFTAGMIMEMLAPAREGVISFSRWLNNYGLALLTYLCNHLFGTFLAVFVLYNLDSRPFPGLANLPLWLDVSVAFLALELTRYGIHVAMHRFPILWRFHAVHHTDSEVDVSTAFRHHPIEGILSAIPIFAVVWLLASAPEALILYRAWDLVMAVLTHTNVDISPRLERWLRYIVVTPAFHRTHHLAEKRFTDSNYSASVPWFDYIFSTYQPTTVEQQKSARIGLETHTANEQRVDGMLCAPFMKRVEGPG
jgi:sterol desaturase/sphingolipid hydroxylase (fatty acid hydroxylase superfamily)